MMVLPVLMLAASSSVPPAATFRSAPVCRAGQLELSLNGRDGDFDGMSHAGTELSIRNKGGDCMIAALPKIQFLDRRHRVLPATRTAPVGMHPGPVMLPVRIASGHRAVADLRWVSGPVFSQNRLARTASLALTIEGRVMRVRIAAALFGAAGKPLGFEQTPLRPVEGMAAD